MDPGAGPAGLRNGHADAVDAAAPATVVPATGAPALAMAASAAPAAHPLANGNGHLLSNGSLPHAAAPPAANGHRRAGEDALNLTPTPSGELGACEGELGAFELVAPAAMLGGAEGPRAAPPPPPLSLEEWGSFLTSEGARFTADPFGLEACRQYGGCLKVRERTSWFAANFFSCTRDC